MAANAPKNAKKLVLFTAMFGIAVAATVLALTVGPTFHRAMTARDLLATGQPGTATITALIDTGNRINMLPVMMISLAVTTTDGTSFHSTAQEIVSPANSAALQPGRLVNIRYNPQDKTLVAIVGAGP
jgi:hypothetical protein